MVGETLPSPREVVREYLAEDRILFDSTLLTVAMVVSGGFNYAYQVYVGRALGPEAYGAFGAVFALQYLIHVVGRGVRFSAIRFTSEHRDDAGLLRSFCEGYLLRATGLGVLVAALLVLSRPGIGAFLALDDPVLVLAIAAYALFGLSHTATQGMLQGLEWFASLGAYQVLYAAAKLVGAVLLVTLGFGAFGALVAVAVAALLVLVATVLHLGVRLDSSASSAGFEYPRAYRYAPPALLAGLCLTVPTTVDVLVVKHFFSSTQAGLYTSVTVLGKIIVFFPMGVSRALFPKVSHGESMEADADLSALFDRAVLYTGVVAGTGALVYWTVPEFVLSVLFGAQYAGGAGVLRWYGLAVCVFVLAITALNFQLARDGMRYVYLFTLLTAVEVGLMWVFHGSLVHIAQVILVVNAVLFVLGVREAKR